MLGIILASLGALTEEVSTSIGKFQIQRRTEGVYTLGFFNAFWMFLILAAIAVIRPDKFVLSAACWPTLTVRIVVEVILAGFSLHAVALADRSSFSFIRSLTMPLLLLADLLLGYGIGLPQVAGMAIIILAVGLLYADHGLGRRGNGQALAAALLAAVTITLYKYDISHYNSVVAEQVVVLAALLVYVFIMALWHDRQDPLAMLFRRVFLFQSVTYAVGGVIESYAYAFGPASVILAAKRSSAVLWSVITGNRVFHEKRIGLKIAACLLVCVGITLLTVGG